MPRFAAAASWSHLPASSLGPAHYSPTFLAIMEGYPTFVISILMIGGNTALIGDIAGHLGCFIFLKDSVNAIAFVALGTSVPGRTLHAQWEWRLGACEHCIFHPPACM